MDIRPYAVTDYDDVMRINKLCHAVPSPDSMLLDKIREGKSWIAELPVYSPDGLPLKGVVGFLVGIIKTGVPYVYNVAVEPSARGLGIGTALIRTFEQDHPDRPTWLQVDSSNPAQRLYYNLGYRVTAIQYDYYGPCKDALSMIHRITT